MRPGKKRREAAVAPSRRPTNRKPESRLETRANNDAVAGRNSVVEALRAKIPAKELLIAERAEIDERMTEALRLAKNQDLGIKEVPRGQLDGVTGTTNHQGIALIIKPFQYKEQLLLHEELVCDHHAPTNHSSHSLIIICIGSLLDCFAFIMKESYQSSSLNILTNITCIV